MSFIKKLIVLPTLFMISPALFACAKNNDDYTYLKILNSEDYIAPDLINKFEEEMAQSGKKVKVIYDTFDTMENMFNTLKTGKTKYDLVCASEYMVQKLINQNVIVPLNHDKIINYNEHASSFVRNRLKGIPIQDKTLDDYCACYMWGSVGLLYNPTYSLLVERGLKENEIHADMETFDSLWKNEYNKVIAIKDSMRDTYAIGLIHTYKDALEKCGDDFAARQEIFDYGGPKDSEAKNHINEIKNNLIALRNNIFGFEVDSGKEDIITEKIGIDTAWSGDATRSIDSAEEEKGLKLYYSIPKEGSNLWFDCWVMQDGAHEDEANAFLNFVSRPDNAIANMAEIGYTSSIASDEVLDYFNDKYKPTTNAGVDYDVGYFFGEGKTLKVDKDKIGRQVSAQFPDAKEVDNLMIMKDYGDNNDLILKMWEEVKHESLPTWAVTLFVIEIVIIVTLVSLFVTLKIKNKKRRKKRHEIRQ